MKLKKSIRKTAKQMERQTSNPLGKMQTNTPEVKQFYLGLEDSKVLKLLLSPTSA